MRRYGWTVSALFHALLGVAFIVIQIRVHRGPFELAQIELLSISESEITPPLQSPVSLPDAREAVSGLEPEETPETFETTAGGQITSWVGVREGINWVSGPPDPDRIPINVAERTRRVSGPIRQALVSTASYLPLDQPGATAVDTLLFAQERLVQIANEVMEEARKAPKGGRYIEPIPVPGSIAELRGEPQIPIGSVAVALVSVLTDLGEKAWDRLTKRDPDEVPAPDLDLTYPQVLVFAALDDYMPLSIFEWYSRLHPDFKGGLGELQQLVAQLADRGLVRMDVNDQVIRYRRIVPLREVIEYFSSYLNRLPGHEDARREELVRILSALVRIP